MRKLLLTIALLLPLASMAQSLFPNNPVPMTPFYSNMKLQSILVAALHLVTAQFLAENEVLEVTFEPGTLTKYVMFTILLEHGKNSFGLNLGTSDQQ